MDGAHASGKSGTPGQIFIQLISRNFLIPSSKKEARGREFVSVSAGPLRNAACVVGQFTNALWLSRSIEAVQLDAFLKEEKSLLQKAEVPDKLILGPLYAFVLDKNLFRGKVGKLIRSLLGLEGWLRGRAVAEKEESAGEEGTILEANRYIRPQFIAPFFQAAGLVFPEDLRPVTQTRLVGSRRLFRILERPGFWKYESELPGGSYTIRGETYARVKALVEGGSPDPAISDQLVRVGLATAGLEIGVQMDLKCGNCYGVGVPSGENLLAQGIAAWLGPKNVLIFVGSEGDLPDNARWKKQPLVLVHTDRSFDPTQLKWVLPRYGLNGMTEPVENELMHRLKEVLTAHGFMRDGVVRTLPTAEEGKAFVRLVADHLPDGWDLIDAFEKLDFGEWRPDGEKDIDATLRTLGQYKRRAEFEGNKILALGHPVSGRGSLFTALSDLIKDEKISVEEAKGRFYIDLPRIEVELFIIDLYLEHPEWFERMTPKPSAKKVEDLRELSEKLKATIQTLAEKLGPKP